MISEIMVRKGIYGGVFANCRMNDFKEFDLYTDILLRAYMWCAKIWFFSLFFKDFVSKEGGGAHWAIANK